ncbi:N-acetylmuramoyl-L-alanine amidase [Brunnivagina elsteri]|uniref:N-acetylmuramoyl-L-alanine amidase n=1 Tax=Brunnivagina elsteri CCALA 953 TaxID=987040 RepID=A0A2A2TAW5_9CYAN|nr:N-acetylmuramoyl-L-alanine amidase [Calothrix elsteri]PAX48297.1 N-acetylmuramoyl-L-alanine amidase [Calothrix elsteri CCALA 953]
MKIALDLGHGLPRDGGAVGIRTEESLINQVGLLLVEKLKSCNDIILTRPKAASSTKSSLQQRCDMANSRDCDIFASLHFNAFTPRANGVEVYAISKIGYNYAGAIVANIARLGYHDRGVKDGSHLYVLRNTKMPALLIEGCFITNVADMTRFDAEEMSDAIAKGVLSVVANDK